ncbi:hypothetical protein WSK_3686 [Novosphingobium sp. Rr 2-17]|uniref:DUF1289 domain-containing protein n=1 Tax=Novosphingobium sp. Rr 2-17 TaxID=555793 RepID=UPI0002697EF3|nr:DUF1289 domain-containing protein [Novosphingobium sp. Rr 2-17]EIZ77677.1 hypothetical protein WSK_3686 [Novosphingobium sp. Rr 2-17]
MEDVPSPCNGICRIDPRTALCLGCARTIEEIMAWPTLSRPAKQAMLAALATRQG